MIIYLYPSPSSLTLNTVYIYLVLKITNLAVFGNVFNTFFFSRHYIFNNSFNLTVLKLIFIYEAIEFCSDPYEVHHLV